MNGRPTSHPNQHPHTYLFHKDQTRPPDHNTASEPILRSTTNEDTVSDQAETGAGESTPSDAFDFGGSEEDAVAPEEPTVDVPEAPKPPDYAAKYEDVDTDLRVVFWRVVFLWKFAVIGLTLGALLFVFDGGPSLGLELLALGAILLGYAIVRTKRDKERIESGEFETDDGGDDAGDANSSNDRTDDGTDDSPSGGRTNTATDGSATDTAETPPGSDR